MNINKKISVILAASVIIQAMASVYAEENLILKDVEALGGNIVLDFSEQILQDCIDHIKLYDTDEQEIKYEVKFDDNFVYLLPEKYGEMTLEVSQKIQSQSGKILSTAYFADLTGWEDGTDFETDYTDGDWLTYTSSKDKVNSVIYDGKLVLSENKPDAEGNIISPAEYAVAANKNIAAPKADGYTYEFEYTSVDANDNSAARQRFFLFKGTGILTSTSVFPRYYYGYALGMRWNNTIRLTRTSNGYDYWQNSGYLASVQNDLLQGTCKIRVNAQNIYDDNGNINSIKIEVYIAPVSDGVTGDFIRIMNVEDDLKNAGADVLNGCTQGSEYAFQTKKNGVETNRYLFDDFSIKSVEVLNIYTLENIKTQAEEKIENANLQGYNKENIIEINKLIERLEKYGEDVTQITGYSEYIIARDEFEELLIRQEQLEEMKTQTGEALKILIENNADRFGYSKSEIYQKADKSETAKLFESIASEATEENIISLIEKAAAASMYNTSQNDEIFANDYFAAILGFDKCAQGDIYNAFMELNEKEAVINKILAKGFSDIEEITKAFAENVVFAGIKENPQACLTIAVQEYFNVDFSRYIALEDKNRVDEILSQESFESIESLAERIVEIIKELYPFSVADAYSEAGDLIIEFSESVNLEDAKNNIKVFKKDNSQATGIGYELMDDYRIKLIIPVTDEEFTGYAAVFPDMRSAAGEEIQNGYKVSFRTAGKFYDFEKKENQDWKYYNAEGTGVASGNGNAYFDGKRLILSYEGMDADGMMIAPAVLSSYVPVEYEFEDISKESYEFDYYPEDTSRTFRFMFRGDRLTDISAAQVPRYYSGYGLTIKSGSQLILKRINNGYDFEASPLESVTVDNLSKTSRIKVNVKNIEESGEVTAVKIEVYQAVYNNGILDDYTKILEYTDTAPNIGTLISIVSASNKFGFGALSGKYAVGDLFLGHIEVTQKEYSNVIYENAEKAIEKIINTDSLLSIYDEVKETALLLGSLQNMGYNLDTMQGYDNFITIYNKIPDITQKQVDTTYYESAVLFGFAVEMSDDILDKKNLTVLKNSTDFDAFKTEGVYDGEKLYGVKIIIPNNKDYTSSYSVTLSKNVKSVENLTLFEDCLLEFVPKPPVEMTAPEINGNSALVNVRNNSEKEALLDIIIAEYNQDKTLIKAKAEQLMMSAGENKTVMLDNVSDENIISAILTDKEHRAVFGEVTNGENKEIKDIRQSKDFNSEFRIDDIDFNISERKITVSGHSNMAGGLVTLIAMDSEKSIYEEGAIEYAGICQADENGKFSFDFGENVYKAGNMSFIVTNDISVLAQEEKYISSVDERTAAADTLNTAKDLQEALNSCEEIFALDNELYNSVDKAKLSALLEEKKGEFTQSNVQDIITEYALVEAYNEGKTDLVFANGEFLYGDILKLSELDKKYNITVYELYNEVIANKEAVVSLMLEQNCLNIQELEKKFAQAVILSGITNKKQDGYGHISKLLREENAEFAEIDISAYNQSDNKAYIAKKLVSGGFSTVKELEDKIKSLAENKNNADSSGTSNKNSNSGGVGASFSLSTDTLSTDMLPTDNISPVPETDDEKIFNDLDNHAWAYEAIESLYNMGVINGKGNNKFAPDERITREQLAKMLCIAFNVETDENENIFEDVEENAWYAPFVLTMQNKGYVNGMGNGIFGVGENVTRQDMAVMIYRTAHLENESGYELSFADSNEISQYAKAAVAELSKNNIINGYSDNTFKPFNSCTRAEAAVMIYRMLTYIED